MTRSEFEKAARDQNAAAAVRRSDARANGAPCSIVTMFAFGGMDYCTTHSVMGACTFGGAK